MTIQVEPRLEPFAHATGRCFLSSELAEKALAWLEISAPWKLHVEDFYEQHECALTAETLPQDLASLVAPEAVQGYAQAMLAPIGAQNIELVEATAHRLTGGQSIRIHNDYIGGEETHRIIIQLNRGWSDENGGFLMLFSSDNANDVARIIRPVHCSAVSFEISPASFHAVSPTLKGERYTLVFSYKAQS
jgi:Rps23 Pro-64 3,4-dihydroxylase Tpa1-like proline 4-hydroxylase